MSTNIPVITIDGPSGSGKGTISILVARKLKWHFLDSGALYRILAFAGAKDNINFTDSVALTKFVTSLDIEFVCSNTQDACQIRLNGENVTEKLRGEKCGAVASKIATLPQVRGALLALQRSFRKTPGLVADGRDMGTVVFPDAILKIYLTATVEERAKRRLQQLQENGISGSLCDVLCNLQKRDEQDTNRTIAPLKPAKDAIIIDTTELSIDEVFAKVWQLLNEGGS